MSILSDPRIIVHIVEEPPLELRVMEVSYPDGFSPLNHHTVCAPLIVGGGDGGTQSSYI